MMEKLQKHFIKVLIISAILATTISLTIGLSQSIWFDEAYSILIAKQPLDQLIHLTALDTHPPLFYLILKGWAFVFGWGELALRSLPVLAMGLAVVSAGLLIKKLFNKKTAIISLPFIVFAPFLLRYGFEIRMYSLASLIGIFVTYILVHALEAKDKKKKILLFSFYALLVAIGMYTLYYLALLWLAHLTWLVWRTLKDKESIIGSPWFKAYIGSVILFIPWLIVFFGQITNGALAPISEAMTINNLLGIITFSFLYQPVWQIGAVFSIIVLFIIASLYYLATKSFKLSDEKNRQSIMLLVSYIVVPILILMFVGLVRPMYVERYLAHVLIGASLWLGVSVSIVMSSRGFNMKILYVMLVAVMIVGVLQLSKTGNYNYQRMQKIDVKSATDNIKCSNDKIVLAAGPYEAIELSYYLPECPIYFYSETAEQFGGYSILSNSKLRITSPITQFDDKKVIHYVRYGNLKLQMPSNLKVVTRQEFGKLVVEKYSEQ